MFTSTETKDYSVITGAEALGRMIRYRRPAGSKTERRFIKDWLMPLGLDVDDYGNLSCRIGTSNVMWSCHTDTVHRSGGQQNVVLRNGLVQLARNETISNCLGADDTAGVWLMREMIMAGKPGLYIFHREEEIGGHGSTHIAKSNQKLLAGIDIAIALDRKGQGSVITHQFNRCCSDLFGASLASGLGGKFTLDDGGIFTDTANYTHLIPECTNISVGYEHAHTAKETLDVPFLLELREKLIGIDTRKLTVARDPTREEDDRDLLSIWGNDSQLPGAREVDLGSSYGMTLSDIIREYPDETADWLECYGVDAQELISYIGDLRGRSATRFFRGK